MTVTGGCTSQMTTYDTGNNLERQNTKRGNQTQDRLGNARSHIEKGLTALAWTCTQNGYPKTSTDMVLRKWKEKAWKTNKVME